MLPWTEASRLYGEGGELALSAVRLLTRLLANLALVPDQLIITGLRGVFRLVAHRLKEVRLCEMMHIRQHMLTRDALQVLERTPAIGGSRRILAIDGRWLQQASGAVDEELPKLQDWAALLHQLRQVNSIFKFRFVV